MIRKYRFISVFWNLVGPPVFLLFSYDLACRFCTAFDVAWCTYITCPSGGTIWSNTSYWYGLFADIVIVILSIGLIFYRKCVVLDRAKMTIGKWHKFLWMEFSRNERPIPRGSQIKLTCKWLDSGVSIKRTSCELKSVYYVIDLTGPPRIEVMKFHLKFRARRFGREIADFLHIPFIEATEAAVTEQPQDMEGKEMIVTRREVEDIIKKWQDGGISSKELVQWSLDRNPDEGYRYADVDWSKWEKGEADSAISEVTLCIEDWAEKTPARELTPILLAFLQSDPSDFEKAEKEFRSALKKLRQKQ